MKTFISKLKRDDGFTLVELMVVVAIIGVLSAVAIPNFKKYQAKAKVSEAKLQLSSIYTAQTAFYSDFNLYHTCLSYMGYDPSAEAPSRFYTTGFNAAAGYAASDNVYVSALNSGLSSDATTGCPANLGSLNGRSHFLAGKTGGGSTLAVASNLTANIMVVPATATSTAFTAGAAGVIMTGFESEASMSKLSINEQKLIRTIQNGF